MKILLVSATKFEVFPILKKLKKVSPNNALYRGRFGRHSLEVLITGVGMTSTAFHLGKTLNKKYDLAINAGVAGSFRKDIALGEVVNITTDCFADLGAENGDKFITLKEMGLGEVRCTRYDLRSLSSLTYLKKVKGITVNTVHGNTTSIKKVVRKFKPDVESMEGAAFFFACDKFKIPATQIRAVSNYIEKRDKKNWKLDLAIKNLNIFLEILLSNI